MPLHPDFAKILDQFKSRYGIKQGISFFYSWINKRKLDDSKPYSQAQLERRCKKLKERLCSCSEGCEGTGPCRALESFQWAKPLIKLFKQDASAKYYQVEAHFAVSSMNNRVYSLNEILKAIHSLPGSGVNLNHVTDWLMPGVEIMAANFEDGAAECIIRVPNGTSDAKGRDLQETMDSGEIDCVSVEVESNLAVENPEGELELYDMKYTGLALLDQSALPGIPLTKIMPLERLVESIFSEMEQLENQSKSEVKEKLSEKTESFGDASFPDSCFAFVPDSAKGPDGKKSDRKLPYKNKDGTPDLPHVRNALARLNQTQEVPEGEKARIRNMLQNILGRENPDYNPSEASFDSLAKANKQLADATEEVVRLTKRKGDLEDSVKALREQVADLSEKLSTATTENLRIPILKERVDGLEQKALTLQSEINVLRGKNEAYAETNVKHEKNVNRLEAKVQRLEEDLAKERTEAESLMRQLNEESVKRATAEQKSLNETNDASKIKQANAKLLEEKAADTRKISELSDQLSESAKKVLAAEEGLANAKAEVKKRDDIIIEKQKAIERADKENKRVHKTLEEISRKHGIYEVDENGNLVLPS